VRAKPALAWFTPRPLALAVAAPRPALLAAPRRVLYFFAAHIGMANPPDSDATLLARARDLDAQALAHIHDQYYPALYRFALYRTGDPELAADIAAEVFVRLLDALHARRRHAAVGGRPRSGDSGAHRPPNSQARHSVPAGRGQPGARRCGRPRRLTDAARFAATYSVEPPHRQDVNAKGKQVRAIEMRRC
jgi:hypothetical protein